MYLFQVGFVAGTLYSLVWRRYWILRLQVVVWAVGVSLIAWRFGTAAQLGFYSNDQILYARVVEILKGWNWGDGENSTLFWWLEYSKFPYPMAALPLALFGIHISLALKTVSLVFLLLLSNALLDSYSSNRLIGQFGILYFTSCALIGGFFSLLALRDTMMMYFVYRFATDRSVTVRLLSIVVLFLLRSHLAAALVVAEVATTVWEWIAVRRRMGYFEVPVLTTLGVVLGSVSFYFVFGALQSAGFGIKEFLEVASNFGGLQFLTQHERFVKLSVSELLLARIVFNDSIIIPIAFTGVCLLYGPILNRRHQFTLVAFSCYVGIATNTDFNSFRQNIPLMPLLGMVVLDIGQSRRFGGISHTSLGDSEVKSQSHYLCSDKPDRTKQINAPSGT